MDKKKPLPKNREHAARPGGNPPSGPNSLLSQQEAMLKPSVLARMCAANGWYALRGGRLAAPPAPSDKWVSAHLGPNTCALDQSVGTHLLRRPPSRQHCKPSLAELQAALVRIALSLERMLLSHNIPDAAASARELVVSGLQLSGGRVAKLMRQYGALPAAPRRGRKTLSVTDGGAVREEPSRGGSTPEDAGA